ncbi:MAG TPA: J domain-containing protein [Gammaproteobacteria bacterium]|nr:J domain-containing protein [Gammaproteobacteria bacterium]
MSDPYHILGVSRNPTDDDVRQAYLAAIRRYPAEQNAARFQAIQHAYETIKTERLRVKLKWFDFQPPTVEDLLTQISLETKADNAKRPEMKLFQALLRGKT